MKDLSFEELVEDCCKGNGNHIHKIGDKFVSPKEEILSRYAALSEQVEQGKKAVEFVEKVEKLLGGFHLMNQEKAYKIINTICDYIIEYCPSWQGGR